MKKSLSYAIVNKIACHLIMHHLIGKLEEKILHLYILVITPSLYFIKQLPQKFAMWYFAKPQFTLPT